MAKSTASAGWQALGLGKQDVEDVMYNNAKNAKQAANAIPVVMEASGRQVNPCGSCLSDLSVILKYGSKEAFGFGVGRDFNAYDGAHRPDEYISCDVLLEYVKIIGTYILKSLG